MPSSFTPLSVRLLFFLLLCCLPACLSSRALRGELHGQIAWEGVVRLQGDVVLAEDSVLTIAPGTRVLFLPSASNNDELTEHPYFPGSELIVRGQIIAQGTAAEPIQFEFFDPTAEAGSWGGVNIEDSKRALFNFCSFRQADSAIHARNSWVVVENSLFSENLVGIRFHDSNILIEKNLLQHNGAAIRFHFGAPVICRNLIRNNSKGLFISSQPRDYTIENNSFIDSAAYEVSLGEGVRETVVLKNNFWGQQNAENLPNKLYDGRLDDWLGTVDYLPMRSLPDPEVGGGWNR